MGGSITHDRVVEGSKLEGNIHCVCGASSPATTTQMFVGYAVLREMVFRNLEPGREENILVILLLVCFFNKCTCALHSDASVLLRLSFGMLFDDIDLGAQNT